MKKILLIITLILPLLLSSESWAIGYDDLVTREGLYYEKFTEVPFTGRALEYYENGQLYSKGNYANGERYGEWVAYHDDGQLWYKSNHVNGKQVD